MGDSVPLAKRAKVEKDPSDRSSVSDGPRTQMDIVFGEHGRKLLQARLDFAIIKLICVAGIPPSIATYQEWREVFSIANSSYQPVSRSTLEDSHIPGEAARVRQETYKYLDTQYDLTISFDGGTIRRPQSVYTVHVTTADGRSFLLEGEEASGDSHTSEHIKQTVLRVINMIGRTHISGLASDSTNNAKTCRRLVCEEIRTIINMPDGPHHMSLTCKDICSLPMFKEVRLIRVIRQLRATITFFRKSTHGTTHLTLERKKLEIPRGIESIGKTRFATICLSAISLERCLVPIRTLVHNSTITIKKNNHLFVKNSVTGLKFEMELTQLISILKPIAKSIACIESSMTTPADVYLFWLAILGSAKRLLDDPEAGFSSENAGQIRAILNTRFREQIEEGPSDCYISAFYLDPRTCFYHCYAIKIC
ncbi:hypothetical protein PLICRDRAFT_120092 [Plicaturopsis crispa FD-325 SS-3]|uniref:DUF659 domain-containing protein n=1 Tax=Plicaturopsis crispa FD-325 SS-3 TaxID=944288 RepID=A0A0C9SPR3_PLICR|nr:hypothetical protein PLICRDRAFT_120092 [Plicaturopsis crispa FD-325 SS-3]